MANLTITIDDDLWKRVRLRALFAEAGSGGVARKRFAALARAADSSSGARAGRGRETISMNGRSSVDTNVLVYGFDAGERGKRKRALAIMNGDTGVGDLAALRRRRGRPRRRSMAEAEGA